MLFLLQLEWKKLYSHTAIRILLIFYMVLLPAILLTGKRLQDLPPPMISNEVFFIFPTIWQFLGYIGNWLCFFFFGFLAVLMVTSEYSNKTMRQNIITGLSRKEYFLGKIYFIAACSLFATLYYTLVALVIGFFSTDTIFWVKLTQNADYVPRYFLMCFGYMIFGAFLGFLIQRTGIALFLYLSYIMFIELILRWGVHFQLLKNRSMHFYPLNAIEDLVPIPIPEAANEFVDEFGFGLFLSPTEAVVTALIYLSLFIGLAWRRVSRMDL